MKNKSIFIIGGGISGLATAHRLMEFKKKENLPLEISILESSPRLGGSIETQSQNGFLLESGPDSFLSEKPWALELCQRLGLADRLIGTNEENRRSFIYRRGRLIEVPEGFYLIAPSSMSSFMKSPLLSWPGKLRVAGEIFVPKRQSEDDESVSSFIKRRLGREALERVGQPMLAGIYTADPETLSLQATMPKFREMEKSFGSIVRALQVQKKSPVKKASGPRYSLFLSFKKGMQELVDALLAKIPEAKLYSSESMISLKKNGKWEIQTSSGNFLADAVVLALSAPTASHLLLNISPEISEQLSGIPYESVATLNLMFRRREVGHPLNGFGFVVPAVEGKHLVGCSFSSIKFPGRAPEGHVLLRAFAGGALHRQSYQLDDSALVHVLTEEVKKILKIKAEPTSFVLRRYPQAMPQYQVGHMNRVQKMMEQIQNFPGLFLTGNAYRGMGIPDCVHHAEVTAEQVISSLGRE